MCVCVFVQHKNKTQRRNPLNKFIYIPNNTPKKEGMNHTHEHVLPLKNINKYDFHVCVCVCVKMRHTARKSTCVKRSRMCFSYYFLIHSRAGGWRARGMRESQDRIFGRQTTLCATYIYLISSQWLTYFCETNTHVWSLGTIFFTPIIYLLERDTFFLEERVGRRIIQRMDLVMH